MKKSIIKACSPGEGVWKVTNATKGTFRILLAVLVLACAIPPVHAQFHIQSASHNSLRQLSGHAYDREADFFLFKGFQ